MIGPFHCKEEEAVRAAGQHLSLEPLVADVDAILFSEAVASEGAIVFVKVCETGLRGLSQN